MSEGQDYLPEGVNPGTPHAYIPPDPGTGTVYVGPPHENASGLRPGRGRSPVAGSRTPGVPRPRLWHGPWPSRPKNG